MSESTDKRTAKEKFIRWLKCFGVRMFLLWQWFLKNIVTIASAVVSVVIILMIFGIIPSYEGIYEFWHDNDLTSALSYTIGVSSSLTVSSLILFKKSRKLLVDDVSDKTKINMIRNNLYFDKNGLVRKRVEGATGVDINGDGKLGDESVTDSKSDAVSAAQGLITVASVRIDPGHEDQIAEEAAADIVDGTTGKKMSEETESETPAPVVVPSKKKKKGLRNMLISLSAKLFGFIRKNKADLKTAIDYSKLSDISDQTAAAPVKDAPVVSVTPAVAEASVIKEPEAAPQEDIHKEEEKVETVAEATVSEQTAEENEKTSKEEEEKPAEVKPVQTVESSVKETPKQTVSVPPDVGVPHSDPFRTARHSSNPVHSKKIEDILKDLK